MLFLVPALLVHGLLCLTSHSASLLRWRLRARSQPLCIFSTLQPSQANDEWAAPTLSYQELLIWHFSACACMWEGLGCSHSGCCSVISFCSGSRMGCNVGVKQNSNSNCIFCLLKTFVLSHSKVQNLMVLGCLTNRITSLSLPLLLHTCTCHQPPHPPPPHT